MFSYMAQVVHVVTIHLVANRVATEYQEETRETEALVVECAYLRREINKLKEELNQLKTK